MIIHHVGYLVKSIRSAAQEFAFLGYYSECSGDIVYDALRGIEVLFLTNGVYRIELVEPKCKDSAVSSLLHRMGSSPYHICYECSHLETTCRVLREKGYVPVSVAEPSPALDGRRVAFWFHHQVGLIELLEETYLQVEKET